MSSPSIATNAQNVLGPVYPYYKNILTPQQMGMSDKGTINQMTKDISGLIEYTSLLVSGNSKASATGRPLGNKFFLKTGGTCLDNANVKQDRYIYIDNVPVGNIPFISSGLGVNFSEFKGLIPGAMGNLNALNPMGLFNAFTDGAQPKCQAITMETIDLNNKRGTETHYVTSTDIQSMDPCIFSNGTNPITKEKCKETFKGRIPISNNNVLERLFNTTPASQSDPFLTAAGMAIAIAILLLI